jgi:hypothetical protein
MRWRGARARYRSHSRCRFRPSAARRVMASRNRVRRRRYRRRCCCCRPRSLQSELLPYIPRFQMRLIDLSEGQASASARRARLAAARPAPRPRGPWARSTPRASPIAIMRMPTPGPCSALRACARSAPPQARVPRAGRGAPLGAYRSRAKAWRRQSLRGGLCVLLSRRALRAAFEKPKPRARARAKQKLKLNTTEGSRGERSSSYPSRSRPLRRR